MILLKILAGGIAVYFAIALLLIASQRPEAGPPEPSSQGNASDTIDFAQAVSADYGDMPQLTKFEARDGTRLGYRLYESAVSASDRLIVLVHGSAWHGMQFHPMARALAQRGLGTVAVPDMRGHGPDPVRRGDVDHVDQLADDMTDLIRHLTNGGEAEQVILGGHSSGGGFVLRFAGGEQGGMADGFILLAPFLKHDAPTARPNSGGWARPAVRRIIGLSMLNAIGITALNSLPAISFAMPQSVLDGPLGDTATTIYSYRMMNAFAPHSNYERDLKAIDGRPLLLTAGTDDEAFLAEEYEPVVSEHVATATYRILPGVGHIGAVTHEIAIEAVADWLEGLETN